MQSGFQDLLMLTITAWAADISESCVVGLVTHVCGLRKT